MPALQEVPIHRLHPTQLTVGMIEVHDKKKHLLSLSGKERRDFMAAHPVPAVLGPGQNLFITDHHHLGRAAHDAGVDTGFVTLEADYSALDEAAFWAQMNQQRWVHPLDEYGVRHLYSAIPHHLDKLVDDAYRSLAGYVRNGGGYQKTPTAFAEFVWADFFRRNIATEDVAQDFPAAVSTGIKLATSEMARGMPGYSGG